ncbi:MAG: hypothetical protein IKX61_08740 [Prevotella sp.]|nr:hypothetical protein [Prevotella sp.]
MKKEYLQPRLNIIGYSIEQPLLDLSMPVNSDEGDPTVEDFDDLLAKPTTLYDVWDDDKEKLDFHTDN